MSTYSYEHTYIYLTFMITSERLSRFDLEIHEVGHLRASLRTSLHTERIINHKCNTHVKSRI
jgi:hypothetical protein